MSVKVRKGQLISTFGPGAMLVDANGISVMTCGTDHWFSDIDDPNLYKLEDKRLADRLNVNHFKVPPDPVNHQSGHNQNKDRGHLGAVRFPRYHICSNAACQALSAVGSSVIRTPRCEKCSSRLYQARFVTICKKGHIDDFPWNEWVHRSRDPQCNGHSLRLTGVGSSSLSGIFVECQQCQRAKRSLAGITSVDGDESTLSQTLENGVRYTCTGRMPWLGEHSEACDEQPIGVLRQASNVYFSYLVSSIHLPPDAGANLADLVDILDTEDIRFQIDVCGGMSGENQLRLARANFPREVNRFSDEMLLDAMSICRHGSKVTPEGSDITVTDDESVFRYQERELLIGGISRKTLKSSPAHMGDFEEWMGTFFSHICLVERLTETRALLGFDRFSPNGEKTFEDYQRQLFRYFPEDTKKRWLPATQVFGEGIYIEFKADALNEWENQQPSIKTRAGWINERLAHSTLSRRESVSPRFLLVHTFAHLLINRLVFNCGYSSASLRERLYVSDDEANPMAGLLIYTASGDSEGSLGGLVRMGKPGLLEEVVKETLQEAEWCSSDPVSTEAGKISGQGPGSLNLSACHSCALIPETSCEEFNLFLDRTCVVSHGRRSEGFFDVNRLGSP